MKKQVKKLTSKDILEHIKIWKEVLRIFLEHRLPTTEKWERVKKNAISPGTGPYNGMCAAMLDACETCGKLMSVYWLEREFPEWAKHKPKTRWQRHTAFWWNPHLVSSVKRRIELIRTIISELESMEELAKRIEMWKRVLTLVKESLENPLLRTGICIHVNRADGEVLYSDLDIKRHYPEMYKHKPKTLFEGTGYWWDPKSTAGTKKRIAVLESIIAELENELNSKQHE